MYTEFYFAVLLHDHLPEHAKNALTMTEYGINLPRDMLPDHEFFDTENWTYVGKHGVYRDPVFFLTPQSLTFRCDIDNKDILIGKFLDWIHKYTFMSSDTLCGFIRENDSDLPTLIYYQSECFEYRKLVNLPQ